MSTQLKQTPDKSQTVVLDMEANECELHAPRIIGWNINNAAEGPHKMSIPGFLNEVQVSHKRITERFVELLNLFEDYSKIMESDHAQQNRQPKLKRTQSEQFTVTHMTPELKATASLTHMQLSDTTLLPEPLKVTCEMSSQTCWTVQPHEAKVMTQSKKTRDLEAAKEPESEQHTLHIEVESVSSNTALQRPPLRQRLWTVVVDALKAMVSAVYLMGENFTYVLFVVLCLWCLYLIIVHYYSFVGTNAQHLEGKKSMIRLRTSSE